MIYVLFMVSWVGYGPLIVTQEFNGAVVCNDAIVALHKARTDITAWCVPKGDGTAEMQGRAQGFQTGTLGGGL